MARNTDGRFDVQHLTAASTISVSPNDRGIKQSTSWQQACWYYYALVPELHYAISFLGNAMSRVRLTIGVEQESGSVSPGWDDNGKPIHPDVELAAKALRQLKGQIGGHAEIMRAFGVNLGLVGECHLVGRERNNRALWDVFSVQEFRSVVGGYQWTHADRSQPENIKQNDVTAVRVWQPDPEYRDRADSSVRACLDVLDELLLLTREIRGSILSRLTNSGILFLADEIEFPVTEEDKDDDNIEPFTKMLHKVGSTAINDKSSAAGWMPIVVRLGKEFVAQGEGWDSWTPDRHWDEKSPEKRKEAVLRLAQGIDLPVEIVTSKKDTAFANATQIDIDTYKVHVEPKVEMVTDAITDGYIHPAIGNLDSPIRVVGDTFELVATPDRSIVARDAFKMYAISGSAYRKAGGFTEADKPTDEEIQQRMLIDAAQRNMNPVQPGGGKASVDDLEEFALGHKDDDAIDAFIEVSVERAIQQAGSRLKSKANGKGVRDQLQNVANNDVAKTLGPAGIRSLGYTEDELLHGQFDALHACVSRRAGSLAATIAVDTAIEQAKKRLYGSV